MKKNKPLLKIIKEVGSATELAKKLKVSQPYVSHWLSGRKPIPATKVKLLVELSNGKVTEEELRPDVFYDPKEKIGEIL
jgi:DNA-binding transcriptional regulator YdaS (Cro superfamily)